MGTAKGTKKGLPTCDRLQLKIAVNDTTGCWEWQGSRFASGYGRFALNSRYVSAHRVSYEAYVGPIPTGLVIDHLCKNIICVNPAHLEPVSQMENVHRSDTCQKQVCKNGHPFDAANTRISKGRFRVCRACDRERATRYRKFHDQQSEAA